MGEINKTKFEKNDDDIVIEDVVCSKYPRKNYKIILQERLEEGIFKEFEELGYEWWYHKKENVFEFNKYDKSNGKLFFLGKIEIELDDKDYWSDIQFTMKEHQLLHRLFTIWGWFDE